MWLRHARALSSKARPSQPVSWVPRDAASLQKAAITQVLHEFTQQQLRTAEKLVPWFLSNMPEAYFRQVSHEDRLEHLKAISALYDPLTESATDSKTGDDMELRVVTTKPGQRVVTFVRVGDRPGTLLRQVQQLTRSTHGGALQQLKVFTTEDGGLCLNQYTFSTAPEAKMEDKVREELTEPHVRFAAEEMLREKVARGEEDVEFWAEARVRAHATRCTATYLTNTRPERWAKHRRLFEQVHGTECVAVQVEEATAGDGAPSAAAAWITACAPNTLPFSYLQKLLRTLDAAGLAVSRCDLDVLAQGGGADSKVSMVRACVAPEEPLSADQWDAIKYVARRIKWLDDSALDVAFSTLVKATNTTNTTTTNKNNINININNSNNKGPRTAAAKATLSIEAIQQAEALTALTALTHRELGKADALAFSLASVRNTAYKAKYLPLALTAADWLVHPALKTAEAHAALVAAIEAATGIDSVAARILESLAAMAAGVRATNMRRDERYALALQLDPKHNCGQRRETPYGAVFVHGRRFDAYHVRFRRIARGGMRLVTPRTKEALSVESARHYDECYNLASAQQLKNKDIPEGGSKGVILIDETPPMDTDAWARSSAREYHDHICRKSVKACTDSLLDLCLLPGSDMLYLGPDEQVVPADINWVVSNAARRGHPMPDAFMSSKPDAGINHKEFGVTSEGVHVFLEAALRASGVDPRTGDFTVKLTGGPDGDVAGNGLRILFRECAGARVVGVADASGCAEDPAGLDRTELLRLVHEALPIAEFDPAKLSRQGEGGAVHSAETVDGASKRDSMHNRVVADVFVPAGGRPGTLNGENWKQFCVEGENTAKGTTTLLVPSSPIIVEGANLFVTPEARAALHEHARVRIVKDSSANKCGVICSSMEILAAHVLSRDEFEQQKPAIVAEILDRLRVLARLEADRLFDEYDQFPGALPDFSTRISTQINAVTDAIVKHLGDDHAAAAALFVDLAEDHLPPILAQAALKHQDRLPEGYIEAAVGSFIAARLVYSEGVHFVEALPRDRLARIGLQFLDSQRSTDRAIASLHLADNIADGDRTTILGLLRKGGARAGLQR